MTAAVFFSLFACSGEAPKLQQTDWMINYTFDETTKTRYEELALYLLLEDADGNDDIAEVYLINDSYELCWHMSKENWNQQKTGNSLWIGCNRLLPLEGVFPEGEYRLLIRDQGGEETESRIFIPANRLSLEGINFPEVVSKMNSVSIKGSYSNYLIWFYDSDGNLIHSKYTKNGTYKLTDLLDKKSISPSYLYVYTFIEARYCGIKTGPYMIK